MYQGERTMIELPDASHRTNEKYIAKMPKKYVKQMKPKIRRKKKSLVGWMNKTCLLWMLRTPNRKWKEFDRVMHPDIWATKRTGHKKVRITIEELKQKQLPKRK